MEILQRQNRKRSRRACNRINRSYSVIGSIFSPLTAKVRVERRGLYRLKYFSGRLFARILSKRLIQSKLYKLRKKPLKKPLPSYYRFAKVGNKFGNKSSFMCLVPVRAHFQNTLRRAFCRADTASRAFRIIEYGQVGLHGNRSGRAVFRAQSATDTTCGANLANFFSPAGI